MKKFSFEFESVLSHRKINEEAALMVLGEAQQLLEIEKNKKEQIVSQLNQVIERPEERQVGNDVSQFLQVEDSYIQGTKYRITLAELDISRASEVVHEAMSTYLEAQKQIRAIEYLKKKAYEEFLKKVNQEEQAALDDVLCAKSIRQGGCH